MTKRDILLNSIRTKAPEQTQFMPLCFFDYFTPMPDYNEASDELEFRAAFHEGIGATFMDWCGGNAYRHEVDPSVKTKEIEENDGLRAVAVTETPVGSVTTISGWPPVAQMMVFCRNTRPKAMASSRFIP